MTFYSMYPIKIHEKVYTSLSAALSHHPRQDVMKWIKDNAAEVWNNAHQRPLLEHNPAEIYRRVAAQELEIVFGRDTDKPQEIIIRLLEEYIKEEDWLEITKGDNQSVDYAIKLIQYIWKN